MVIKTFPGGNPSPGSVGGRQHQSLCLGTSPSSSLLFDSCLWLVLSVRIYLPGLALRSSSTEHYMMFARQCWLLPASLLPVFLGSDCQSKDVALREWDVSWEDKSPGRCQEQSLELAGGREAE